MRMNVNLTPQLEEFVLVTVASGRYASASEVVCAALWLMGEQDRARQLRLDDLRREVREGLDSGPSEAWDAAAVKTKARDLRARQSMPRHTSRSLIR